MTSGAPLRVPRGKRGAPPPEARSARFSGQPDTAFDPRWKILTYIAIAAVIALRAAQLLWAPHFSLEPDLTPILRRPASMPDGAGALLTAHSPGGIAFLGAHRIAILSGALAAFAGFLLCAQALAKRLFSPMTAFIAVLLLGAMPSALPGTARAASEALLLLFWSLTLVWIERALFAERRAEQDRAWVFAGLAAALGVICQPAMLLLLPCLLLYLAASRSDRAWLRRRTPALAFALPALLCAGLASRGFAPPWWAPEGLWLSHAAGMHLEGIAHFCGNQLLLAGPVVVVGGIAAAVQALLLGDATAGGQRCRFLALLGLPVLALQCGLALLAQDAPVSPSCGWCTLTLLLSGWLTVWTGRSRLWSLAALAAVCGAVGSELVLIGRVG